MNASLCGKQMEGVRKRKRVEAVTDYEKCVREQSNFSFPGTENYTTERYNSIYTFKYKEKNDLW